MIFCTVAGKEQAANAIVWAQSVKQHHPDAWIIACFAEHHLPSAHSADFDELVLMTNHGMPIDSPESLSAVKAYFLNYLLMTYGDDVVYLDPFVKIFHPLVQVLQLMNEHPIIAVPYNLEPCDSDETEIERMSNGMLHAGFLALSNSDMSRRFTEWWSDRTAASCYREGKAVHADRKWLTLGMVPFRIHILKDAAYHAALWNVQESGRRMSLSPEGGFMVGGSPLCTFCFASGDAYLDYRSTTMSYDETALINGLVQSYKEELERIRQTLT